MVFMAKFVFYTNQSKLQGGLWITLGFGLYEGFLQICRWIYFQSLEDAGIREDNGKDVFPLATFSSFLQLPFHFLHPLLPALPYTHHALLPVSPLWQRLPAPTWGDISRASSDQSLTWAWSDKTLSWAWAWSNQALPHSNTSSVTPKSYGQCWEVAFTTNYWVKNFCLQRLKFSKCSTKYQMIGKTAFYQNAFSSNFF